MQPAQTPITGREDLGDLRLPLRALARFYAAASHSQRLGGRRSALPSRRPSGNDRRGRSSTYLANCLLGSMPRHVQ